MNTDIHKLEVVHQQVEKYFVVTEKEGSSYLLTIARCPLSIWIPSILNIHCFAPQKYLLSHNIVLFLFFFYGGRYVVKFNRLFRFVTLNDIDVKF